MLEGAIARIDQRIHYSREPLDIFDVAALYAIAIAKAHAFNDGNKRTALISALTFLEQHGNPIPQCAQLEEAMVDVAQGHTDEEGFATLPYSLRVAEVCGGGPAGGPA